jgi:DNA-binding MarR family transcriptional regulator
MVSDEGDDARDDFSEGLESLTPSAKLVFKVLQHEGTLTSKRIVEETRLPSRTVRYALEQLKANKIVTSETSFMDARQTFYSLTPKFQDNDSDSA